MPGRNASSGDYRYSFNGKEQDDEVKGITGSSYDFGSRMYDPRLGRWMSIDKLFKRSPDQTTYNFSFNSPLIFNDPNGEYPVITITDEVVGEASQKVKLDNGTEQIIKVKLYKVIITDTENPEFSAEYAVTRDAWNSALTSADGKYAVLTNKNFRPIYDEDGTATFDFDPTIKQFPDEQTGEYLRAGKIMDGNSNKLPAQKNIITDRDDPNVATDILIHSFLHASSIIKASL